MSDPCPTENDASSCKLLIQSGSHSVFVNNGSGVPAAQLHSRSGAAQSQKQPLNQLAGMVIATPLMSRLSRPQVPVSSLDLISKILIKACVNGGSNKESKTFSLRNLNTSDLTSVDNLRNVIKSQLKSEVQQTKSFDVGYLQGNTVVSIRSREDLLEVWANIKKGDSVTLWCNGLNKSSHKRARSEYCSGSEDEQEVCKTKKRKKDEEREDKVGTIIKELKEKHGTNGYTPMQYRVWAEMVAGGVYTSTDNSPTTSMFVRAGGGTKKNSSSVTVAASGSSPAKVIENRSKCYKQLSDLKNLLDSGVLSILEYNEEKATVMATLKKLS